MKRQCQFNEVGDRCPEPATRKWGDHWFCNVHGARTKPEKRPPEPMTEQLFRIKPLVWEADNCTASELGFYEVFLASLKGIPVWAYSSQYTNAAVYGFSSKESAKSAAEADFRSRLMAHLEEVK